MALRISEIDNTSKCVIIFIKDEVRIRNRKPHLTEDVFLPFFVEKNTKKMKGIDFSYLYS